MRGGANVTNQPMRKVLKPGAVYLSDCGHAVCIKCAGASALYTGRDISGQKVERVTVEDIHDWQRYDDLGPFTCDAGCTVLAPIAGPDGWPMVRA